MTARQKTILTRTAIGAVILFNPLTLAVMWYVTARWSNSHPDTGENVAHVDWLPNTAHNISYYDTSSFTAYECSMKESDFRSFAIENDYPIAEIDKPQEIRRFGYMQAISDEAYKAATARVVRGLFAQHRQSNGGGYHIVFDRETERLYFQSSAR